MKPVDRRFPIGALVLAAALLPVASQVFAADTTPVTEAAGKDGVPEKVSESRVRLWGKYRLAAGVDEDFILNDANADLQDRNFRYLFGERLNNTFDPAIYDQCVLNVEFLPRDKFSVYTQLVADPWSWVGTTGEQIQTSDIGQETIRYNLKYFGAFNSTLNETFRTNNADSFSFPLIKAGSGELTAGTVVKGFNDFNPATKGIPFTIPPLSIDYELRPIRKLWMDYNHDNWHLRLFALADESAALTTDDPLELSNHKDYWQQSPWLYQYVPIRHFTDSSIKRGYYSDSLSFLARDSEGNRLVLLRGASFETDLGRTYLVATVAAPFTPWDEKYRAADNVPGAVRLKHLVTERLMMGAIYTFRNGLINNTVDDLNQVLGLDFRYRMDKNVTFKGEMAVSQRDREALADPYYKRGEEGFAYKAVLDAHFDHKKLDGHTDFEVSYTQMDEKFNPLLSRYSNTRDDHFWGNHLTFTEYPPGLEHFRIGDGVDVNRTVLRVRWKERLWKKRCTNLFDVRNVHKTSNLAYKETVIRDELTYIFHPKLTGKGLFRWQGLPKTTHKVDPFVANFYVLDVVDPVYENVAVTQDRDPSRFTYAAALQYIANKKLTLEGFVERTNDMPDFPRTLLNNTFRDANDRLDGLLIDHITNFLYGQTAFGTPPYPWFTIVRERVVYKPDDPVKIIFHAAQNSFKFAGGIDDNINHEGVSVTFVLGKKWNFFADYTHSRVIDVPHMVATDYTVKDFGHHHNVYASLEFKTKVGQTVRVEYGVFGLGTDSPLVTPYSATSFSLPTIDTEHLFRVSLTGEF